MSVTEDPNQTGQTGDQGGTDWETIFGSAVGGTASFGPDFKYTRRVVQGFGPNITPEQQAAIRAKIGYYGTPGGKKSASVYQGEFLVDGRGYIIRSPYDPAQDKYDILYGMGDAQRATVLSLLKSRGFYGSSKPSATGTLATDRNAFGEFLQYANSRGYTWDAMLAEVVRDPNRVAGAGGGAGYRVTPSEDIGAYLRKASLERLGRTMSKADVDKAIAAIQGVERTQGPQAPNIGVMAEQQVVKLNPNEDKAVRFRRAIDVAMNLLGG